MFVYCVCSVLSGRGLSDGLITRPEEFYRLWRVAVCDQETSWYEEAIAHAWLHSQRNKLTNWQREREVYLTKRKTYASATLFLINFTRPLQRSNPCLHGWRLVTNLLSHCTGDLSSCIVQGHTAEIKADTRNQIFTLSTNSSSEEIRVGVRGQYNCWNPRASEIMPNCQMVTCDTNNCGFMREP
jgi:hypothetical protein